MVSELDVLKDVTKRLDSAQVQYMLTGSFATNFYSIPRMTRDIDIVVDIAVQDVENFRRLFSPDYYVDQEMISEAVRSQRSFNVIHNGAIVKIDFIVRKSSPYRKMEFDRRRMVDIDGAKTWIAAPEDLAISKLLWAKEGGSETQLSDVRNLLKTFPQIDWIYLNKWAKDLDVNQLLEEAKK